MAKKVCIDAGHGGADPGAVGNGLKEKDINLKVALKVEKLLKEQGIEVTMTRTTDKTLELADRVRISNNNKVDAFISIHCNSASATAKGIETFSSTENTSDLATKVHKRLLDSKCYTRDRGLKTELYYVLKNTNARACLLELAFISNTEDANILKNKQDNLSLAIAKGICDYLGIAYKEKTPANADSELYYRVVVGSFKDKKLAEKMVDEAKGKGFENAFIVAYNK